MHFLVDKIQSEVANTKRYFRLLRVTAPERTHTRQQFLHREGFREIIIRPELQTGDAIIQLAARGQHQHPVRHILGAQSAQDFEAIDARQSDVEHQEIERFFLNFTQGGLAIVNHNRVVARFHQGGSDMP